MIRRACFILILGLIASPVLADTLWNNGTPDPTKYIDSPPCNDCFNTVTHQNQGFVDFDNFRLTGNATITGFSFASGILYGSNYGFTEWYLWNAKPDTAGTIGSPLMSGSVVATPNCVAGVCYQSFSVTKFDLAPGTYWIGFSNKYDGGLYGLAYGWQLFSTDSPLPGGAGQLNYPGNWYVGNQDDFAFTVLGSYDEGGTPAVPEPATASLLCGGVAALAGVLRNKLHK